MTKELKIQKAMEVALTETIRAVIAQGGFEDGHTSARFKPVGQGSPWNLVIYKGQLSSVKMGTVTCLNPIELRDGVPTLSRWSFGGNVDLSDGITLQEGVDAYNSEGDWDSPVRKHQIQIVDLSQYQ